MASTSVAATVSIAVDLDCLHSVTIEVPAGATNSAIREGVELVDQTVHDYRNGRLLCPTCHPHPVAVERRIERAATIADTAGQWLKVRTRDGRKAYGIPSQSVPGLYHLTTARTCTCRDFQRRQRACKHVLSLRMHVARIRGQRFTPAAPLAA